MMVFVVICCYVLGGKLGLEEGKTDFRTGGSEGWDFNRYSLNSSGDIAHGPNHWCCCCLESDDFDSATEIVLAPVMVCQ